MVIITGIGRSGTSFTAKVLTEAGADFKGAWFSDEMRAGMEYYEVVRINQEIYHGRAGTVREAMAGLGYDEHKLGLGPGVMVKDPRFLLTLKEWLDDGFGIEHIIYCRRDYEGIYRSSMKSGAGLGGYSPDGIMIPSFKGFKAFFSYAEKMFFHIAEQRGVPVTVVNFPDSVRSFSEIEKLSGFVDPSRLRDAWDEVRNPDIAGRNDAAVDNCPTEMEGYAYEGLLNNYSRVVSENEELRKFYKAIVNKKGVKGAIRRMVMRRSLKSLENVLEISWR